MERSSSRSQGWMPAPVSDVWVQRPCVIGVVGRAVASIARFVAVDAPRETSTRAVVVSLSATLRLLYSKNSRSFVARRARGCGSGAPSRARCDGRRRSGAKLRRGGIGVGAGLRGPDARWSRGRGATHGQPGRRRLTLSERSLSDVWKAKARTSAQTKRLRNAVCAGDGPRPRAWRAWRLTSSRLCVLPTRCRDSAGWTGAQRHAQPRRRNSR